jgi:TatD DNase family protein
MRTTAAAASDVANLGEKPEVFWDALFRDAKGRIVKPPALGAPAADTHAHLDMLHHPELALARCAVHGVDFVVTVVDPTEDPAFTYHNLEQWQRDAQRLLETMCHLERSAERAGAEPSQAPEHTTLATRATPDAPSVRVIIGCHPHNAKGFTPAIEQQLLAFARDSRTVAVGEIGLDYHYDLSPRDVQQRVFRRQISLAHELELPIALHLREAHDDGLRILREEGLPPAGTLLHCFNLDYATLEPFLELGCFVAFGGPITFKKSDDVRDAARRSPIDRIVTETDAPFMAPHPLRGTVCGPENTVFSAAKLVEVFGLQDAAAAAFCQRLHHNALAFFGMLND